MTRHVHAHFIDERTIKYICPVCSKYHLANGNLRVRPSFEVHQHGNGTGSLLPHTVSKVSHCLHGSEEIIIHITAGYTYGCVEAQNNSDEED